MKKFLSIVIIASSVTGCATQPWTKADQVKFEKEHGVQTCPAFFSCYSLIGQEKTHQIFIDKD